MIDSHVNTLIVGHSFSRRLRNWAFHHGCLNLNLDRNRLTVFWQSTGGATVLRPRPSKMIWQDIHFIRELDVDIVFVDIGSNDLSNRKCDWLTPKKLAQSIVDFAKECLNQGAKQIMISEILPRQNLVRYNERVVETNDELQILIQGNPKIYLWRHRQNNFSSRFLTEYVHEDGVHVDYVRGMARYFSSVRGSVIVAENRLRQ